MSEDTIVFMRLAASKYRIVSIVELLLLDLKPALMQDIVFLFWWEFNAKIRKPYQTTEQVAQKLGVSIERYRRGMDRLRLDAGGNYPNGHMVWASYEKLLPYLLPALQLRGDSWGIKIGAVEQTFILLGEGKSISEVAALRDVSEKGIKATIERIRSRLTVPHDVTLTEERYKSLYRIWKQIKSKVRPDTGFTLLLLKL